MKRLSSINSPDSDCEFDIGDIKNKYKRPRTDKKVKESTSHINKEEKKEKLPKNQLSLQDAFNNTKSVKRPAKNILENYFKPDIKPIKEDISPSDFFSSKKTKISTESVSNFAVEVSPVKITANIVKSEQETKKFVVEKPLKAEQVIESFKTPTKETSKPDSNIVSTPNSASKKSYHAYLHRAGPSALGTKEIPEGSPNCLSGMTFVMTGVLDSIDRPDAQSLIERHGGRVTKALSGKTTYLIIGTEPGDSKIQKAVKLNTKQITEDDLFEMIRKSASTPTTSKPVELQATKTNKTKTGDNNSQVEKLSTTPNNKKSKILPHVEEKKSGISKEQKTTSEIIGKTSSKLSKTPSSEVKCLSGKAIIGKHEMKTEALLVDKYKPQTFKQIVGQQGDRSPANKLKAWLTKWAENFKLGFKKNGEADHFKGALLSGSPGIGKTTTAHVVAKELGYTVIEYNASVTRSKNQMAAVQSTSMIANLQLWDKELRYCIVMDEIDGMSGNEDRGGLTELIAIIKNTKVPFICICNDRQSRKLQSIANYLYDLRFRHLTLEQVKAAVKSVIFKEKIQLPDEALNEIVMHSNFDLRQVLNNIQMWSVTHMDSDDLKAEAKKGQKEFKLGPFEVVQKVFSHENVKTMTQKSDLFFEDYSLIGLFVQENYLKVSPFGARNDVRKTLKLMSLAADSIATSDIVSSKLRSTNNWGLLPLQGMYASVIPGEYLHGRMTDRIVFPSWLGKFSKQNKNKRILSNLCMHMRNSSRGGLANSSVLAMDYSSLLVSKILKPLREGDIETTLHILDDLDLLREDIDLLIEATAWSHLGDPLAAVTSQIKGALTRAYNKSNFKLPYSIVAFKKGKGGDENSAALLEGNTEDIEEEDTVEDKNDGVENDSNIVKKKVTKDKLSTAETKTKKKSVVSKPKKESVKRSKKDKNDGVENDSNIVKKKVTKDKLSTAETKTKKKSVVSKPKKESVKRSKKEKK